MKIILKKLSLLNFKGIREKEIQFGQTTDISGENAAGKTTIKDAWLWLLFGKDSTDRKDFEIKTLDDQNRPIGRLDHQVTALVDLDGQEITISRIYREKYVKKKGEAIAEFAGHETTYLWNDVPCNEKEYQTKISEILNENVFKLISNNSHFNLLPWKERRNVLLAIAGEISNNDIFDKILTKSNHGHFTALVNAFNNKKSIDDFKKEINAKKKTINDELVMIPARIDEAKRNRPEEMDYAAIQDDITATRSSIDNIDQLLTNKTKQQKQNQETIGRKQNEIFSLQQRLQEIEFTTRSESAESRRMREANIIQAKADLRTFKNELSEFTKVFSINFNKKTKLENQRDDLRSKYDDVNRKNAPVFEELAFSTDEFCCPTCKRAYDAADVDEKKAQMIANHKTSHDKKVVEFNEKKVKDLAELRTQGINMNSEIQALQITLTQGAEKSKEYSLTISNAESNIAKLESENNLISLNEVTQIETNLAENKQYNDIKNSIEAINDDITRLGTASPSTELMQQKAHLQEYLDEQRHKLSTRDQKEKSENRVRELTDQETKMANELAELEGIEFSIEQFVKAKMDMLVERINGMFKYVRFKMFDIQINGAVVETCETLISGVPYADANNAARINAGLDVINTLSGFYDAFVPVFVDNAEAVNKLIPVQSQLIRLIVSKDKKLKIEASKQMAEVA